MTGLSSFLIYMIFMFQFDPAVQRYIAMTATRFDNYKVNAKTNIIAMATILIPLSLYTALVTIRKVCFFFILIIDGLNYVSGVMGILFKKR